MTLLPDAALVERFSDDLAAALGRAPAAGDRFALGVSGGPDSMAMLVLAAAALPGQVTAATVDHRLRAEAAAEAALVARYCASIEVPHAILAPAAPPSGASLQARARELRYRLLVDWAVAAGAGVLLTAHHMDDQAETFLMRAARGSGVSGLAAIRERREAAADAPGPLLLLRPLLGWRRAELRRVVRAGGIDFVDDPTNLDPAHDRTRFRRLLDDNGWLDVPGLARSAAHAAEAERAIAELAELFWDERARIDVAEVTIDVADLPRELRRRLARKAIATVRRRAAIASPEWNDACNVEPLLDALDGGTRSTQAGVMADRRAMTWRFRAAPPRRSR